MPFALLFPDRVVSYMPSGTTHGILLHSAKLRGTKVLGLGDPVYRTRAEPPRERHRGTAWHKLAPLPATRTEVEAVADVRLLGAEATHAGLQAALKSAKRWRAVHLACHGLVDPEEPMLSGLALSSAGPEDDGMFTCREVWQDRIVADLVVLSACETARGRIYASEGIVGLTRAFMFAGAPRVLCSLWKVDDDATQALMVKFYALWNPKGGKPGLPAAEALKAAQAHIRAQGRWSHPYYWAAWVLWGLPQ